MAASILTGCQLTRPRPQAIPVDGQDIPHKISAGEVSKYDGWVIPSPLFAKTAPAFREALAKPDAAGETADESDETQALPVSPNPKWVPHVK